MGGARLSEDVGGSGVDAPVGPPYLLDTHIWVWYVIGSERLGDALRIALDDAHTDLWLSPISVWEVAMLHDRGRLGLRGGPRRWVDQALERFPLHEAPLTREIALRSHEVVLEHRYPADRMLAATALVHDLTLVTVDERLVMAPGLRTRAA